MNSAFFISNISNIGLKGNTESYLKKKNVCYSTGFTSVLSPAKFMLLLRGNDCLYLCVHCLYHPVCIGKLATIPCNPSVVLSQGTVHLELQDEGLYSHKILHPSEMN